MTATNVRVQMQQRRDTAANWTAAGPTLLAGEIGYETDTGKIKIGDGTTAWASLAYLPIPDSTGELDDDLTITGDLTVQGTTTTIESTTLTVEDKNIELAVVDTPTDSTADGGGITLKGATDKTINWVDATDAWTFSEHVNIASGKEFRIDGTKVLDATSLGSAVVSSSLTSVGTIGTGVWEGTAIDAAYLDSTVVTTSDTGTVTSTMIENGTIVDADINASAAIAGTKIDPDFGSQTVETTGVFSAAAGSNSAPSITFTGDLDTGFYSPSADEIGASVGGGEALRIDSSGRLLVGTSSWTTGALAAFVGNSTVPSGNGVVNIARGQSVATLNNGDALGGLYFSDNAGNTFAEIASFIDATPGSGDYPGRLVFSTTADGASSPTERMKIDSVGRLYVPDVYASTTGAGANVVVESDGRIRRSTSSAKYKTQIETLEDVYSDNLLKCRPVWYRSTCEGDNPEFSYWGFIAEEVAEIDPRLVFWKTLEVTYDENGSVVSTPCVPEPEGVQYDRFVPHLLNLIKRQKEQIEAMEARLSALEAQ